MGCSEASTFALMDSGELYSWGAGKGGVLGIGSNESSGFPLRVPLPTANAVEIETGKHHVCVRTEGGRVYYWGNNKYGQLGLPDPADVDHPLEFDSEIPIAQVACGIKFTLFLTTEGKVLSCGMNSRGELGLGSQSDCESDVSHVREIESHVNLIAASDFAAALTSEN